MINFTIGFLTAILLIWAIYKIIERYDKKAKYLVKYDASSDEYHLIDGDLGLFGEVIFACKTIEELEERHKMILERKKAAPSFLNKN